MIIKTASWFTPLPADHVKIGISRGVPRRMAAGYRLYRELAPGAWFNRVSTEEYIRRYQAEILDQLDPHAVAEQLADLTRGAIPVLCCFERVGGPDWCHRALAAQWLAEALGEPVPEFGYETLSQAEHPLMAPELRRRVPAA